MQTENIFITHPSNASEENALKAFLKALKIKFEIATNDKPYNEEFVKKILESEKQYKKGESKVIKTKDLWK